MSKSILSVIERRRKELESNIDNMFKLKKAEDNIDKLVELVDLCDNHFAHIEDYEHGEAGKAITEIRGRIRYVLDNIKK